MRRGRKRQRSGARANHRLFCPGILSVSDREAWANEALGVVRNVSGVPESVSWRKAQRVMTLHEALLFDVNAPFEAKTRLLHKWARRGLHHVTICCVSPAPGAASLIHQLESLGCEIARPETIEQPDWSDIEQRLYALRGRRTWIAVAVAQAIECLDEEVIHALNAVLDSDTEFRAVNSWAGKLRASPSTLYRLFYRKSVGFHAKSVLDSVRLLRVAASGSAAAESRSNVDPPDRATGSVEVGSRAALARWVKKKTGLALGSFTGLDLGEAVQLVTELLRRHGRR